MSSIQTVGATTKLSQHEILPAKNDVGALANRINAETRGHHDKVDKMMSLRFALALRDAKIYRQGLQSFYHVFASIETSLSKQFEKDDQWTEMLKSVWKPEIARRERAEQDLLFYYDDRKDKFIEPIMPEQIAFSKHILEVTEAKPYLLFAYLHVMYLALFAGGRIMRSSFAKATGLFPQKNGLKHEEIVKLGTNFFAFDVADEDLLRVVYKRDYELVTRNGLTEDQKLEIIEESKYIFEQNGKCIMELEQHNLQRLRNKWSYFVITRGYYVFLAMAILTALFFLRRVILHLL
ncbi:heme binding protein [Scheffersomyces amazonensis]|uniref:heme binding protein n=1 Tax=Scheffersomyces amazonensis TaxID=1078765 RepID=UPI00315CE9BC